MKKRFYILFFISVGFLINSNVFSAPNRSQRSRSASTSINTIRGNYNTSTNTYTGTKTTTTTQTSNDTLQCGIAPDATNNLAKRQCAIAMAEALKLYCASYPCNSKIKVELSFNFALPSLEKISSTINGESCSGANLDKFCAPFQSSLINDLWDLYSEQSIRDRKNCDMAKAKYSAAQDCFAYIQSAKNNSVGNRFSKSKITELDKEIDKRCGKEAIINKYKSISIDDWTEEDENTFFKNISFTSNATGELIDSYQGEKQLSSTVASLFANIGDNTWNYAGQIGRLFDLNFSTKSSTYPRELVVIANTFVTEGEAACGKDFKVDMETTSFEISDSRSALEKQIAKKGILKGLFDFGIDNTVGAISEDKAQSWKEKGILGKVSESKDKKTAEQLDKILSKLQTLSTNCNTSAGNFEQITTEIKSILNELKTIIGNTDRFEANKEKIREVLDTILTFKRDPNEEITITSNTQAEFNLTILKLETLRFTCPNGDFNTTEQETIQYEFSYDTSAPNVINTILNSLKESVIFTGTLIYSDYENGEEIKQILAPLNDIK